MIQRWRIRRALENQVANLRTVLRGHPVTVTPLLGGTLDPDDVTVAGQWMARRAHWSDDAVVHEYERAFAEWNGSRHAFAFMGGRVALSACLSALDLAHGDEVILPGYTCVVVLNAVRFAGLEPVLSDIELDTYGLDAACVAAAITPRTRVIVLQHLYGLVCRDYEALLVLAERHGLRVIEDCAHATGARYRGVRVGNRGTMAIYSSEQSKVYTTMQGGMAVTNDDSLAQGLADYWARAPVLPDDFVARLLVGVRLTFYKFKHRHRAVLGDLVDIGYGHHEMASTLPEEYEGQKPAHYGARMTAPVAAVGLSQLRKLDAYGARRRETAEEWDVWCSQHGYAQAKVIPESEPVYLRYPVMVEREKKLDASWAHIELEVTLGVWFGGPDDPTPRNTAKRPREALALERCVNFPTLRP